MAAHHEHIEGKYEILEKLHEGGMGAIYRVRHRLLDSIRVIKTMRPQLADDEEFRSRFLREAQVAIRLDHPNIAKIYDFSVAADGMAFIAMEFISGMSLRQLLRGIGPPEMPLTLEISRQTLAALGFLHRQGYVHRDIAPDNVMLTADADRLPQVKLIDLGIAKSLAEGDDLTAAGQFVGKARYSSPEHFAEHGPDGTDARSDVYSFGVVLYELLTGRTPIEGWDLRSLSAGHLYRPPVAFEESDPGGSVPGDLRRIVERALAKRPEDRFPDTRVFSEAVEHVRLRFPLPALDVERLFDQIRVSREVVESYASQRTQVQLDKQFSQETTPTRAGYETPDKPTIADLDLPAPEAIIARLDELAAGVGEPAEPGGSSLDGSADSAPEPATNGTPRLGSDELRRPPSAAPDELQKAPTLPAFDALPLEEPSPTDDYQTESTFLPTAEPAPSFAPPATAAATATRPLPVLPPSPEAPFIEEPSSSAAPPALEERIDSRPGEGLDARSVNRRRSAAAAAAIVAIAAVLLLVFFGPGRSGEEPDASLEGRDARASEAAPSPAVTEDGWLEANELHPALIRGRRCLITGDPLCAIIALKVVESESLSLAPVELELLGDLRAGLEASLPGAAGNDDPRSLGERLVDALAGGPITELRDVVDAIAALRKDDPESFADLSQPLAQAGEIVAEWRRMWRLKRSRDHLGVVRIASRLAELYPPYAERSLDQRDEAAEIIEAQAEELATEGDPGTARARLAELRQALPGRPGIRARIVALDQRLSEAREIEALIARAENALGASDPHRGLELLEQIFVADDSRYASSVADLKERLQRRLLDMDRLHPVIRELPDAEYRRNDPVRIPLEITDDYRVENVRAWARAGREGVFSEVTVHQEGGSSYVVEVPAAIHDNKRNLEFYVWVADRSGHTATLGTEADPRSLRRKGLF